MAQTLPTPDLTAKTNQPGYTYDAAQTTIWYAEEYEAIRGRILTAAYSVNSKDLWIGGQETITSDRDFVGRQIACSGAVGSKPWADGAIAGLFYYGGKVALRLGQVTGTEWDDANIGTNSVAIGYNSKASGAQSVALGNAVTASSDASVAIGGTLDNGGQNAVCAGYDSIITQDYANTFGFQLSGAHAYAVVFGSGADGVGRLASLEQHGISIGGNSTVPTLHVSPGDGTAGSIGLVGIGLGATLPTKAYLEVKGSTADFASLSLAHGTAPTVPNNGDIWTTTAGLYVRVNGATIGPLIDVSGVSSSFSSLTGGTNTTAAMVVGTGASLGYTGSGTIDASSLIGGTWAIPGSIGATTPAAGAFTTLTAQPGTDVVTLIVKAKSSGTADIADFYDASGNIRHYVTKDGWSYWKDGSSTGRCLISSNMYFGTQSNIRLFFESNGGTLMTFDDIRIGIGDTSPSSYTSKLFIKNALASDSVLRVRGAAAQSGDLLKIEDSSATGLLRVDTSGNVVLPKTSGVGFKVDPASPTFGWRDITGSIETRGSSGPTWTSYRGNIYQYAFPTVGSKEVFCNFHMPHDYTPGTDVYIHAHWSQNVVDTGAAGSPGDVKWYFDVSWAKGFNQAAFSAPITTSVTQTASSTQYQHLIAEVQLSAASPSASQLDSDDLEVDGVFLVRCYRDAGDVADTLDQVPFLHFVDIHYQSTNMATKNKAPNFYS